MAVLKETEHKGLYLVKCPACDELHSIASEEYEGNAIPTWDFNGNMEKPTFSPSLHVSWHGEKNYICHSFIRNGMWEFCGDSTHGLAGRTVPMLHVEQ